MKVYALPVGAKFQPLKQPIRYPSHNRDYGVEQDFHRFLNRQSQLVVDSPRQADWHYLPIYWTRWHLSHDYARTGIEELQREVDRLILDEAKVFTVCQYDDGPVVDLGTATVFLASRKTQEGVDIPLLSSPHRQPWIKPRKRYLASFVGRKSTHPIRADMFRVLADRDDIHVKDASGKSRIYVKKMLGSQIALCPRGYGGNSFRFYEAMQLGVVPFLIGDLDTRPFKKFIRWDEISLYTDSAEKVPELLNASKDRDLLAIGETARAVYKQSLTYQKWCRLVIRELEMAL